MGRAGFDRAGLVLAQIGPGREGGLGQCGGGGHAAQYMTSPNMFQTSSATPRLSFRSDQHPTTP